MPNDSEILSPAETLSPAVAAVKRCMIAYKQAYSAAGTMGVTNTARHKAGCRAYRMSLPRTESLADIQAFINCIAQGVAIGAFEGPESSQLLYAAQVSLSAIRRKPAKE
jgi:hypothetical protein